MRAAPLALALLALAVAAAGCGDGDTKTVTRTVTAPQPTTTTNDFPPPPTDTTPTDTTTTERQPVPSTTETAPPSSGPTQEEAQDAARAAANDYTDSQYGISGTPDDWEAVCTGEEDIFSCAVTFNGGQCNGRLNLVGDDLTARDERIGCGE